MNRCHLTRGHFSWALLRGSFLLLHRTFQQKALQEQDSPQPCDDQRPSSSGESRVAGDAHCAVTLWELLCRNGAQRFRWAKGTAWKHPLPRQEQSDYRGFPAFGRILLDGSRPLGGTGNFYCAAPFLLRVCMQIATPCCILMTKWTYLSCKLLLLWEGMRAGCNSASVSHWRGVFGEVSKIWTLNSYSSLVGLVQVRQDSRATERCESSPLQTSYQTLFKPPKPFLPSTDVGLYTAFLKVSDNETERWNCSKSHLVSLNFGKTPLGKMDSMKVEPIHALQSRCRALWMTTSAIKWKACITKMERVFWAGRNWDMRVRLMVKPLSVYLSFPFVTGVLLFWNR